MQCHCKNGNTYAPLQTILCNHPTPVCRHFSRACTRRLLLFLIYFSVTVNCREHLCITTCMLSHHVYIMVK